MHKRSVCISYGKAVYHIAKRYIIEKYLHIPLPTPRLRRHEVIRLNAKLKYKYNYYLRVTPELKLNQRNSERIRIQNEQSRGQI